MPGMPSTLSHWVSVPRRRSMRDSPLLRSCSPAMVQYSCTPSPPLTVVPTAKAGLSDATTTPTPPARITSPMPTGGM
jgi:hypothetical protein